MSYLFYVNTFIVLLAGIHIVTVYYNFDKVVLIPKVQTEEEPEEEPLTECAETCTCDMPKSKSK